MWTNIDLRKCVSFIECGFQVKSEEGTSSRVRPAITISRMTGAGGHAIASKLADYLHSRFPRQEEWTVFDRNLVGKILEDHHHNKHIAEFMQEGHKTMLTDVVEEWMGLHPGTWTLVQQTNATLLKLAQMGRVILVGRGASVVAGKLANAFHVRLVGSLEKRINHLQRVHNLDQKSALRLLKKEDEDRRRYLKDNFDKDIDDPLLYHVIINTDRVDHDQAAGLIGDEVIKRFKLASQEKSAGIARTRIQH
ncbi:MAG TPA: cytidylate kinase-like family protein [Syntrophorhabdaceae bacterium]|jgi:hypothetical protein